MNPASPACAVCEAAKHFAVDPSTVRRWIKAGCPVVRQGRRGPGGGARLNLDEVAIWRGLADGPPGITAGDIVLRIAETLEKTLRVERVDIRADISSECAAAALMIVWDQCCKTFGISFRFDAQPEPIRALMREL